MIKTDSRRIVKGDIFVALRGIKSDGHNYIEDAINNGCSMVICEYGSYSVPYLIVSDTREYLKQYIKDNYSKYINDMTIIGITGTNGKTTIASFIHQTLNKMGSKCSMIGTLGFYMDNKVCSLPNTCPDMALLYEYIIESYNNGYKCVVIEASSQGLDEDRLYGVLFDFAVFTNLTHDHLDYHGSIDNYIKAKQKLFSMLKSTGKSIINIDDPFYKNFYTDNAITYGFNQCDFCIEDYFENGFKFKYDDTKYEVLFDYVGKHNIYNMMVCIIVLYNLQFSFEKIMEVVKTVKLPKGRMEIYKYKSNKIIIDYAHTPDAIEKVLSSLSDYNKIYAVFGCTGNRDRDKRPIMTNLLLQKCEQVIITSDDLYDESFESIVSDMLSLRKSDNYDICYHRGLAIKKGISFLEKNDILLVLGKGHEEYIKIADKLIPFSDSKVVLDITNLTSK